MRRPLAATSALVALLAAALLGPVISASAQSADPAAAHASDALHYLFTLQGPDGSIDPGTPAYPNPQTQSETAYTVMGAVAAGMDPNLQRSAAGKSPLDYLASHSAADACLPDAGPLPTAEVILAVVAADQDPRNFGPQHVDLVQRLEGTRCSGTLSNKKDGIFAMGDTGTQALGLLAELASATPIDARTVSWLQGLQNIDGSWNQGAAAGSPGNVDSTAIAVMALAGVTKEVPKRVLVLNFLTHQQGQSGGFGGPDSDGLAIQALIALGQSPTGPAWTKSGQTPLDDMLTYQTAEGGFRPPGDPPNPPDGATTAPLPAAILLRPLPLRIAPPPPPPSTSTPTPARRITPPAGATAVTVPSTPAAVDTPTAAPESPSFPPVAVLIPTPSTSPMVGGVRALSTGHSSPSGAPASSGMSGPLAGLATAIVLALLIFGGVMVRARRTAP